MNLLNVKSMCDKAAQWNIFNDLFEIEISSLKAYISNWIEMATSLLLSCENKKNKAPNSPLPTFIGLFKQI